MKLDKLKIILMSILFIFSIGAMGVYELMNKEEDIKTDAVKFKEEYEILNDKEIEGTDKTYKNIEIPEKNPFVYASYEEVFDLLDKTGVLYLGYPECPWCRSLVPLLAKN